MITAVLRKNLIHYPTCWNEIGSLRVRIRGKQYLRETADEGKLKRVMKWWEYFYVEVETEGGEVVAGSEQLNPEQPRTFRTNVPSEAR